MPKPDTAEDILKDLSLSDMAVLLIRTTADNRRVGTSATYTMLPYRSEKLNVELWACPEFIHMHDGKTHYTKGLSEAIQTTELPALTWIHENCEVQP